jgi:hypothetical protein
MMNAKTNANSGDPADLERAGESIRADMDETLERCSSFGITAVKSRAK